MSAARATAVLVGLLALSPGCVALHRGGIYAGDLDQVFVAYFDNDTFYRDLQFQLTAHLQAELDRITLTLQRASPAPRLVPARARNGDGQSPRRG